MLIYKTKKELAEEYGKTVNAVNNWEKSGIVIKLTVQDPKNGKTGEKKAGYIVVRTMIKKLAELL